MPTVASLKAEIRQLEGLLRLHCRSPLMAGIAEFRSLRAGLVEQIVLRHQILEPDLSFDAALGKVRRVIESELRHLHKLRE